MKDMYADLEKIEARGKRKKEKSKSLFSSFGKKEDATEDSPTAEPEQSQPISGTSAPEPAKPMPLPVQKQDHPKPPSEKAPAPAAKPAWQPPTGPKLEKANADLHEYKKWVNKGYKSGVLTKDQCIKMVKDKEMELGLRPHE